MVWVNFGERRRGIWWTGCRAMFLSSSLKYVLNYLKILAMENVKIQGLSGLSRDLRPSSVIFSLRNFSSFNWVKLFTKSLQETCNQFFFSVSLWTFDCLKSVNWNDSHIFILVINYSLYTKQTFNIFKERNKNVKNVLM